MLINEILYQNICPVSKQQTRLSSHFPISSYVSRKPFCPISYKFLNLVSISSPPPTLFSFHPFYICPTFLAVPSGREMKYMLKTIFSQIEKIWNFMGYDTFWWWHTLREDSKGLRDQKAAAVESYSQRNMLIRYLDDLWWCDNLEPEHHPLFKFPLFPGPKGQNSFSKSL